MKCNKCEKDMGWKTDDQGKIYYKCDCGNYRIYSRTGRLLVPKGETEEEEVQDELNCPVIP